MTGGTVRYPDESANQKTLVEMKGAGFVGADDSLEALSDKLGILGATARFEKAVPVIMNKPDAGNTPFIIEAKLYDSEGNMEDPDNNEILVRVMQTDGTYITGNLYKEYAMTTALDNATDQTAFPTASGWRAMERPGTGMFNFYYKIANDETEEQLTFKFGYKEGWLLRAHSAASVVGDVSGDLTHILKNVRGTPLSGNIDNLNTANETDLIAEVTVTTVTSIDPIRIDYVNWLADGAISGSGATLTVKVYKDDDNGALQELGNLREIITEGVSYGGECYIPALGMVERNYKVTVQSSVVPTDGAGTDHVKYDYATYDKE